MSLQPSTLHTAAHCTSTQTAPDNRHIGTSHRAKCSVRAVGCSSGWVRANSVPPPPSPKAAAVFIGAVRKGTAGTRPHTCAHCAGGRLQKIHKPRDITHNPAVTVKWVNLMGEFYRIELRLATRGECWSALCSSRLQHTSPAHSQPRRTTQYGVHLRSVAAAPCHTPTLPAATVTTDDPTPHPKTPTSCGLLHHQNDMCVSAHTTARPTQKALQTVSDTAHCCCSILLAEEARQQTLAVALGPCLPCICPLHVCHYDSHIVCGVALDGDLHQRVCHCLC